MTAEMSFLFPKKFSPNANRLYSTRLAGISLAAPNRWNQASVWRAFQGTDTLTGYSIADLAALPFGCRPIGGIGTNQGGFAVYAISKINNALGDFSAFDQAEWDSFFGANIAPVTFDGISTNAIALNLKNTGPSGSSGSTAFSTQQWFHFYRDLTLAGIQDLSEYCIEWVTSFDDLATKLTTLNKYLTNYDVKTGGPGDQRFTFGVKMSAGQYEDNGMSGLPDSGKLVWYAQSDSRGSTFEPTIPVAENYFRYINNTVSVPAVGELFRIRVYTKRAASFSDQSGRFRVEIWKSDGSHHVLFDCTAGFAAAWNAAHPASGNDGTAVVNAVNATMGKVNRKTERIYIGNYFGGLANQNITTNIAAVDIWDGYPDVLPDPDV